MRYSSRLPVRTFPLRQDCSLAEACADAIEGLREDVIGFHDDAIAVDGGVPGIRDAHALESAVARPFTMVAGEFAFATGLEQAAALLKALV